MSQGRLRGLIKRADVPRLAAILVAVAVLLGVSAVLGDQLQVHVGALQTWIGTLGVWGVLVFAVLLVMGTSLLLPESLFGVAAGVLFGLAWGMAIAVLANACAAAVQYALARWWLRAPVQRALDRRPAFVAIQHAVMKDQLRLQFLLRLTPVNPATVSYLLGSGGVRFSSFMVACLGLLPHICLEVYLGHAGERMLAAGKTTPGAAHEWLLASGLLLGILAIVVLSKLAHTAVQRAVGEEKSA